jgi:hypothetical protein
MHRNVRRVCFVLLFGLVIEGALTFPLLAIWYGFPKVSATHVCADLRKVMYSNPNEQCDTPNQFPGSPISGPSNAANQSSGKDIWGVQPQPLYAKINFREFVNSVESLGTFSRLLG